MDLILPPNVQKQFNRLKEEKKDQNIWEGKKRRGGKPILCQRCGQGGGTLVKVNDGVYIHTKCLKQ